MALLVHPVRGGHAVLDRRLGAILVEDTRNHSYPVAPLLAGDTAEPPPPVEWPVHVILNQGREGSCIGMALTHELIAEPSPWRFTDDPASTGWLSERTRTLRETHAGQRFAVSLYHQAQRIDEWPGGAYPGAKPRMEGTSLNAGMKVLERLSIIAEYRWAFTGAETALAVCEIGPVVIAVPWTTGMSEPSSAGRLRPTGRVAGGHAVALTGADLRAGTVTVTNSWGRTWGRNGKAILTIRDLDRLLQMGGQAAVPLTRSPQATVPVLVDE